MRDDDQAIIHEAIQGTLDEGEIAVAWTLTIDVANANGMRYLAHRAGGGHDGNDGPMIWTALGMLRGSVQVAERQLLDCTGDPPESD